MRAFSCVPYLHHSTCITPEEQQAIDEEPMDLDDAW
jgi:hypothetical protein